ncbi:hypothetical protein HYC85_001144 [Camellia sinensis]|uniref:Uncharacterized protein n=1 Tax=Camellia sinensis TaxID=4442 RepID=A0A7J7I561_CAMSI|nr:hypothetical protein HYC85_001144 [Camellia sinensis]
MGPTANTPRSQVQRQSDSMGVKDSLPLTRNRRIFAPSHEAIIPGNDKVTDDIQVRLVDDEVRVQPTRGERSGRGYGAYRGGRGRGGRGNLGYSDQYWEAVEMGYNMSAVQIEASRGEDVTQIGLQAALV